MRKGKVVNQIYLGKKIMGYIVVLAIFGLITIFSTVFNTTVGSKLASIEQKIDAVREQKRDLQQKLSLSASLIKTAEKADTQGWNKPVSYVYVSHIPVTASLIGNEK